MASESPSTNSKKRTATDDSSEMSPAPPFKIMAVPKIKSPANKALRQEPAPPATSACSDATLRLKGGPPLHDTQGEDDDSDMGFLDTSPFKAEDVL
eukprot:5258110-Pyramimonas_sp.AAC.1